MKNVYFVSLYVFLLNAKEGNQKNVGISKQLPLATDYYKMVKILWKSMVKYFFCVQSNKEMNTGLEQQRSSMEMSLVCFSLAVKECVFQIGLLHTY